MATAGMKMFISAQDLTQKGFGDVNKALKTLGKTADDVNRKGGVDLGVNRKTVGELARARREAERMREQVNATFQFAGLKNRIAELQSMGKLTSAVGAGDQARAVMARQRAEQKAQHDAQLDQMILGQRAAKQQKASASAMLRSLSTIGKSLKSTGAIAGATMGGLAFASVGVGIAFNDMKEKAQLSFETIYRSGSTATKLMSDLQNFAAATPFDLQDVVDQGRQLAAFGFKASQIVPLLTKIGDAAAGLGLGADGIQRIGLALGQMKQKGKIAGDDIRQLAEAGVPVWDILADKIGAIVPRMAAMPAQIKQRLEAMKAAGKIAVGVDLDEKAHSILIQRLQKMAEQGRLPFDQVFGALQEGLADRFGGLMAKQADTLTGRLSNLHDEFQQFMGSLTEGTMGTLKDAIGTVTSGLRGARMMLNGLPGPLKSAVGGVAELVAGAAPILGALAGPIGTFLGGAVGSMFGPGGTTVGAAVGGAVGTAAAMAGMSGKQSAPVGATPFARGGVVNRPTLALIGEAGPEAVIPLANGGVFGAGSTGAVGAIGSVLGMIPVILVNLPRMIGEAIGNFFKGIGKIGTAILDLVVGAGSAIWNFLQAAWSGAGAAIRAVASFLVAAGSDVFGFLGRVASGAWNAFAVTVWAGAQWAMGVARTIGPWLTSIARGAVYAVSTVANFVAGVGAGIWNFISGTLLRGLGFAVRTVANWVVGAGQSVFQFLGRVVAGVAPVVRTVANWLIGVGQNVFGLLGRVVAGVGPTVRTVANWLVGAGQNVFNFLGRVVAGVAPFVRTATAWLVAAGQNVFGFLGRVVAGVAPAVTTATHWLIGAGANVFGFLGRVVAGVAPAVSTVANWVMGAGAEVLNWLGWVKDKALGGINFAIGIDWAINLATDAFNFLKDVFNVLKNGVGNVFRFIFSGEESGPYARSRLHPGEYAATGGLTRGPVIAGEAGPELILPLSNAARMRELLGAHAPLLSSYLTKHQPRFGVGMGPTLSAPAMADIGKGFDGRFGPGSGPGGDTHFHYHQKAPVYGFDDFERAIRKAQQRNALRGALVG